MERENDKSYHRSKEDECADIATDIPFAPLLHDLFRCRPFTFEYGASFACFRKEDGPFRKPVGIGLDLLDILSS